jgi:hypothetical protein
MRQLRWSLHCLMIAVVLLAAPAIEPAAVFAADAQPAIKAGDILTGKLRLVRTHHDNGTKIEAYQIVSAPLTMPSDDGFCEDGKGVTTFHLFTMNNAERNVLKPLLGKTVAVKADELFCSQTAWHIGDVAVPKWKIVK